MLNMEGVLQAVLVAALLVVGGRSECLQCPGVCSSEKIDLTFVIDGSGSICNNKEPWDCPPWDQVLSFLSGIVDYLDIRSDGDRVAFVQFGNEATMEFGLSEYTTKSALKAAIMNVPIKDENTNTSGGLKVMRTQAFSTPEDRPEVTNVALVISDGKSTRDTEKTLPEARRAEEAGIRVFSIGVTSSAEPEEVVGISGYPRQENTTYWFVGGFDQMGSLRIIRKIFDTFCRPASYYTTTPSTVAACPGTRSIAGCYVIKETPRDWTTAESDCQSLAVSLGRPGLGHLATIPDNEHNELVEKMIRKLVDSKLTFAEQDALRKMWLGGFEESKKNPEWRWVRDMKALRYQGCFADSPTYPEFTHTKLFSDLTPTICINYCTQNKYTVAAVKDGKTCGCGNIWGAFDATEGCTSFCSGDNSLMCGGTNLNDIYLTSGEYDKWQSDQPNNLNNYQPCGKIIKHDTEGWVMVDTLCYEKLSYICDVPAERCVGRPPNYYTINGHCMYLELQMDGSWFDARLACKEKSGDLFSIDSAATLQKLSLELENAFATAPFWVGLVRRLWQWQDGQEFIYTSWMDSQPNTLTENCVIMEFNQQNVYGWNEANCGASLPYICYIDLLTVLSTTPSPTRTATTRTTTTSPTTTPSDTVTSTTTTTTTTPISIGNTTTPDFSTEIEVTTEEMTTAGTTNTTDPPVFVTPDSGASTGDSGGLNTFWIVLIVLIIIALIIIFIVIAWCCCCKKDEDKIAVYPAESEAYYTPYVEPQNDYKEQTIIEPKKSKVSESYQVPVSNQAAPVSDIPAERASSSDSREVPVSYQVSSNTKSRYDTVSTNIQTHVNEERKPKPVPEITIIEKTGRHGERKTHFFQKPSQPNDLVRMVETTEEDDRERKRQRKRERKAKREAEKKLREASSDVIVPSIYVKKKSEGGVRRQREGREENREEESMAVVPVTTHSPPRTRRVFVNLTS